MNLNQWHLPSIIAALGFGTTYQKQAFALLREITSNNDPAP
jgi:hypothetical protein